MEYKYTIGDKTYYQKPLVLGQIKQLETFLEDFIIPSELNVRSLMSMLGNKLPYGLAIALIEEGKSLADRFHLLVCNPAIRNLSPSGGGKGEDSPLVGAENLQPPRKNAGVGFGYEPLPEIMNQIALEIAININLKTSVQVIKDFFACNPTASIFQELSGIINVLGINSKPEAGLTNSAPSSPEETSQNETTSSGDTPLRIANLILNTVPAT